MDVVGTFEACIEKEKLGGKANISNIQRRVHEIDIQNAANDIGLPLYVFNLNRDMKWSRFIPVDQRRKQCRYYITLVRYARIKNGQEFDAFNRVTPDDNVPGCITCNCSMNPPLTGKYFNVNKFADYSIKQIFLKKSYLRIYVHMCMSSVITNIVNVAKIVIKL